MFLRSDGRSRRRCAQFESARLAICPTFEQFARIEPQSLMSHWAEARCDGKTWFDMTRLARLIAKAVALWRDAQ